MPDTTVRADKALWEEKYQVKNDIDIAYGRMMWVSVPGSINCIHMTKSEFEFWKEMYRRKAVETQKETDSDCVVYATKAYENGKVKVSGLCIIPLSLEEYDRRTDSLEDEMVYTVYRRWEGSK